MTAPIKPVTALPFSGKPYKAVPLPLTAEPLQARPTIRVINATILNGRGERIADARLCNDAAYIVHACNSLPRLEAEIARLREALENMVRPMNDDPKKGPVGGWRYPTEEDFTAARAALAQKGVE